MNAGEQLAKNIRELQERNKGRKVWSVRFDDLVGHVFCSTEKREHITVFVAALSNRHVTVSRHPTNNGDVECVSFSSPIMCVALDESYMKPFVTILRRNGIHGTYRRGDGTGKEYKF
jgi:hypothetical protein